MSKELAKDLFIDKNRNCAEAVYMAACERYGLPDCENTLKAIGVFGGGIGTERLCGAVAGAVAAIAVKYSDGNMARTSTEMKDRSVAFMNDFMASYDNSDLCKDIKPVHFKEGVRCLSVVETAMDILDKHME